MDKNWKATHKHKKGGLYRVLHDSVLSSDDLSLFVVYDDNSGRIWVRPKIEFDDGRFEKLPIEPLVIVKWMNMPVHYDRNMRGKALEIWEGTPR